MARDELDLARRFEADLRRLTEQYPELATPAAQARLEDYLHSETEKENSMPAKGQRAMGVDTTPVGVRLPRDLVAQIDAHVKRMRREHPYLPITRVHALSDLIRRACAAIAADITDTVTDTTVTDTVTDTSRRNEPPLERAVDAMQESVVPEESKTVKTARPKTTAKKPTARPRKGGAK